MKLFEHTWLPREEARAVVVIVHGYAEHGGRYGHVGEFLARRGYAVYAFDLRGHGRSEGERAFVNSFDEYLDDAGSFLETVRGRNPGRPLFLLGHSLGGAIATLFTIERKPDIRGLVLSGPLIKFSSGISPVHKALALLVGSIFPRLPAAKRLDSRFISRDPRVVDQYERDPLVYRGWTLAREGAWR